MNLETLDWNEDFDQLVGHIQTSPHPIKIKSFFSTEDPLPRTSQDMMSCLKDHKVEVIDFNHKRFIQQIKNGTYTPYQKQLVSLEEYALLSSTLKPGEDLIPLSFANTLQKKVESKLFPRADKKGFDRSYYFRFFLGFAGQEADPHFDWVNFNNILIQLYGHKKIYIFSPDIFGHLSFVSNFLELSLDELLDFSDEHQIPYTQHELKSGESLFIPLYHLHAVKYVTDSSSLSLRFLPEKNGYQAHQDFVPNNRLAQLLWKKEKEISKPDQNYEELLEVWRTKLLNHMNEPEIGTVSSHSLQYEMFLQHKQRTFEAALERKIRKQGLVQRGAAFFDQ